MPAPAAKDEWITAFTRYITDRTDRGGGKYTKPLAEQAWRERGDMTGEQAAMRWVGQHEPKAHEAPRRRTRKDG